MNSNIVSLLQLKDVVWVSGIGAIIVVSLVQALSQRYKPWLWLLEKLGEAMNKEMLDNQDRLEKKVDKLKDRLEKNEANDEKNRAIGARRRILRFADEIRKNERHSHEFFNEVLNDIKAYKLYCDKHPEFENDKAIISIEIIEEVYKKCIQEDSFL